MAAPTGLNERHLAELRESGLTDETIAASRIRSVSDREIRDILGWQPKDHAWGEGWAIPFDGNGDPYWRVKLDYPRHSQKGEPVKYESPRKAPNRAYCPPGFSDALATSDTLIVTEGEKKSLAVSQLGLPCLGLVGVWGWQEKRSRSDTGKAYGKRRLISDLADIDWGGKTAAIAFDSDVVTKPEVQLAEARLAEALRERGATVRVIRVPASDNGKVGVDDFLVVRPDTGREELLGLLKNGKTPELPEKPAPMDWGKRFLEDRFTSPKGRELAWWRDEYLRWDGRRYVILSATELEAIVYQWLDERQKDTRPRHAADVVKALAALCRVDFGTESPCFLKRRRDVIPANIIAFRNGLLDITNIGGELRLESHSPHWFSPTCLAYDFDENADCPGWQKFLGEVLPDDASADLLRRWFGLMLTPDTSFQKLLLMVGPKRSGKGTVLRVLQHVLGHDACVSPTLSSLAGEFGLWQLLGKTCAMFPDASLGRRVDTARVVELIKSISGEDHISVNRKNLPYLPNVRLGVRFILTVNELPRLTDTTLALEARILPLVFPNSFAGREDRTLEGRLKAEASGILNWALGGLFDLRGDGEFGLPEKSAGVMRNYRRLASPVLGFIEDVCVLRTGAEVPTQRLFEAWETWCEANGHKAGSTAVFGEHLRSAEPSIQRVRRGPREERCYVYTGIELVRAAVS